MRKLGGSKKRLRPGSLDLECLLIAEVPEVSTTVCHPELHTATAKGENERSGNGASKGQSPEIEAGGRASQLKPPQSLLIAKG